MRSRQMQPALILSNELVDAFPCRVFEKRPDGWRELALRIEDGRVMEEWVSRPLPDSTVFLLSLAARPAGGSAGEFSAVAAQMAARVKAGSMLDHRLWRYVPCSLFPASRRNAEGLRAPSAAGRP